jgi:electron transfer flavoprotein alpha subunit
MKSFVYLESSEEGISSLTRQIALKLRKISLEQRGPLIGITIGKQLEGKESQLNGLMDELRMVEIPSGSESNTEVISKVLAELVGKDGPALLFLGFTHQGMELGPAIGYRLQVPVITNCTGFEWADGHASLTRPINGGKFLISLKLNVEKGAVISVPKGAWKEEEGAGGEGKPVSVTHVPWSNSWGAEMTEVLRVYEEELGGEEDITKADILVSIGRGLGDAENIPMAKELADKLGGMISCSRPVADFGWLPVNRQVGISGKTVAPTVYLALGISGQGNHVAGMDGSRIIIAVNKDPSAPIFDLAHYGVVDDILQFIPQLREQLKQKK